MLIIFEGLDGSGKSTHLDLIKKRFEEKFNVITTREPGGTETGKYIREILLHGNNNPNMMSEYFLFVADRINHISKKLSKLNNCNNLILCDRFHFSTFAYQIYPHLNKYSKEFIEIDKKIGQYLFSMINIDLILYFTKGYTINRAKDRIEQRNHQYFNAVSNGFDKSFEYYKDFRKKVFYINHNNPIKQNHENIVKHLNSTLTIK